MLTVEASTLADALKTVKPAVSTRPHNPITVGVHVHSEGGELILAATNLDLSIEATMPCGGDDIDVVVPHGLLATFADNVIGIISAAVKDNELVLESGTTSIELRQMARDEWPNIRRPDAQTYELPAGLLATFGRVAHAAGHDDARPILKGVELAGTTATSTDSYRLASLDVGQELPSLLIPAAVLATLGRAVTGPATLSADHSRVSIAGEHERHTCTLLAGEFPHWQQLIPKTTPGRLVVDRESLIDAVALCDIDVPTGKVDKDAIRVTVNRTELTVSGTRKESARIRRSITASATQELTFGFNPGFLIAALKACTADEVTLEYTDPLKPVLVREGPLTQLLMPIRLS